MVLVDTPGLDSRAAPRRAATARSITVDFDDVVTCLPVVQEVLQGIDDEGQFRHARAAMLSLPIVESPLRMAVVDEAVDLYRRARARRPDGALERGLPDRRLRRFGTA